MVYLVNCSPSVLVSLAPRGGLDKDVIVAPEDLQCVGLIHVDELCRDKLDTKSKPCYLISYGGDEMGYCLWDDVENKLAHE